MAITMRSSIRVNALALWRFGLISSVTLQHDIMMNKASNYDDSMKTVPSALRPVNAQFFRPTVPQSLQTPLANDPKKSEILASQSGNRVPFLLQIGGFFE